MSDFQELPPEYKEFFDTGVLPASLAQQATPPVPDEPQTVDAPTGSETTTTNPASPSSLDATPPEPQTPNMPDLSVYERLIEAQQAREAELRQQVKAMQEQMAKLTAAPAPDPTTDPLGYLNHQMKTIQDQINAMQTQTQTQQQTQQQQQDVQQFVNTLNGQIAAFKSTHTDYDAAYKHVVDMRMQDYRDMGLTDLQGRQMLGNEERTIAMQAMQQGKNPAEVVYKMAQRMGYKAAAATPTATKLDTIRKGQEAAKTVEAGARATAPTGEITRETLENASDAELTKLVSNDWEKIFGKSKGIFG